MAIAARVARSSAATWSRAEKARPAPTREKATVPSTRPRASRGTTISLFSSSADSSRRCSASLATWRSRASLISGTSSDPEGKAGAAPGALAKRGYAARSARILCPRLGSHERPEV